MPKHILHHVDLRTLSFGIQMPSNHNTLVQGDLHGNVVLAAAAAHDLGVCQLQQVDKDDFVAFGMPAVHPIDDILANNTEKYLNGLARFDAILDQANWDKDKGELEFIGDTVAERGADDWKMLSFYRALRVHGVKYSILASNHDFELIKYYTTFKLKQQLIKKKADMPKRAVKGYQQDFYIPVGEDGNTKAISLKSNLVSGSQFTRSLSTCITAIEAGCYSEEDFMRLVEENLIPAMKLLSYHKEEDGTVYIHSHAPIDLEVLVELCKLFDKPYDNSTEDALFQTIDSINEAFQQHLQDGRLFTEGLINCLENPPTKSNPIQYCLWNRNSEGDLIAQPDSPFPLKFLHGHVGALGLPDEYESYENIDCNLGRPLESNHKNSEGMMLNPGEYSYSTESGYVGPKPIFTYKALQPLNYQMEIDISACSYTSDDTEPFYFSEEFWTPIFACEPAEIANYFLSIATDDQIAALNQLDIARIDLSNFYKLDKPSIIALLEKFNPTTLRLSFSLLFIGNAQISLKLLLTYLENNVIDLSQVLDIPLNKITLLEFDTLEGLDELSNRIYYLLPDHPNVVDSIESAIQERRQYILANSAIQNFSWFAPNPSFRSGGWDEFYSFQP